MQFFKKIAWTILLLLLFGGLIYGGIFVRNVITAKNYSDYWQQQMIDGGEYVYVALGDSTALGVGATDPSKSYVGLLKSKIESATGKSVRIINLATLDANISSVISDQIPKLQNYKPDLVTVTVGANDVDSNTDPSTIVQKFSTLFGLLPDHVSYVGQIPSVFDKKKDLIVQNVNASLIKETDQAGVNMVPLYNATKQGIHSLSYYDWDLYHPNDRGYAIWADSFWSVIQQYAR